MREFKASWQPDIETGMIELHLKLKVRADQPNARRSNWTPEQRQKIAEVAGKAALDAIAAIEANGLR